MKPTYEELEAKCAALAAELEAAEKRIAEPVSAPDERAAFETFMEKRFKDCIDRRMVKNGGGEYFAWDMQVAWITWQGRAAMLQGAEQSRIDMLCKVLKNVPLSPSDSQGRKKADIENDNQQFESLSRR